MLSTLYPNINLDIHRYIRARLCGLSSVAEDDNRLCGGIALNDGHRRASGCQILTDQTICRDGVHV